MRLEKFENTKVQKISESISKSYPSISYATIQKLLRHKDVKINGKRVSEDLRIEIGDEVTFYINELPEVKPDVVFEDDNIIVVFKNRNLETVSETDENDLLKLIKTYLGFECFAVHRLDRNTEGLVVFAKNKESKNSLDLAFKNRTIEKHYLALVYGCFSKDSDNMIAYLKKHADKSFVEISDVKKDGFEKIQTNYKVLKSIDDKSLVDVELVTGKTHQIRAHFAHIGHFLIGDEKYGDSKINKLFKKKYQCLCAYRIIFNFKEGDCLSYLNGKELIIDKEKIDFCRNV